MRRVCRLHYKSLMEEYKQTEAEEEEEKDETMETGSDPGLDQDVDSDDTEVDEDVEDDEEMGVISESDITRGPLVTEDDLARANKLVARWAQDESGVIGTLMTSVNNSLEQLKLNVKDTRRYWNEAQAMSLYVQAQFMREEAERIIDVIYYQMKRRTNAEPRLGARDLSNVTDVALQGLPHHPDSKEYRDRTLVLSHLTGVATSDEREQLMRQQLTEEYHKAVERDELADFEEEDLVEEAENDAFNVDDLERKKSRASTATLVNSDTLRRQRLTDALLDDLQYIYFQMQKDEQDRPAWFAKHKFNSIVWINPTDQIRGAVDAIDRALGDRLTRYMDIKQHPTLDPNTRLTKEQTEYLTTIEATFGTMALYPNLKEDTLRIELIKYLNSIIRDPLFLDALQDKYTRVDGADAYLSDSGILTEAINLQKDIEIMRALMPFTEYSRHIFAAKTRKLRFKSSPAQFFRVASDQEFLQQFIDTIQNSALQRQSDGFPAQDLSIPDIPGGGIVEAKTSPEAAYKAFVVKFATMEPNKSRFKDFVARRIISNDSRQNAQNIATLKEFDSAIVRKCKQMDIEEERAILRIISDKTALVAEFNRVVKEIAFIVANRNLPEVIPIIQNSQWRIEPKNLPADYYDDLLSDDLTSIEELEAGAGSAKTAQKLLSLRKGLVRQLTTSYKHRVGYPLPDNRHDEKDPVYSYFTTNGFQPSDIRDFSREPDTIFTTLKSVSNQLVRYDALKHTAVEKTKAQGKRPIPKKTDTKPKKPVLTALSLESSAVAQSVPIERWENSGLVTTLSTVMREGITVVDQAALQNKNFIVDTNLNAAPEDIISSTNEAALAEKVKDGTRLVTVVGRNYTTNAELICTLLADLNAAKGDVAREKEIRLNYDKKLPWKRSPIDEADKELLSRAILTNNRVAIWQVVELVVVVKNRTNEKWSAVTAHRYWSQWSKNTKFKPMFLKDPITFATEITPETKFFRPDAEGYPWRPKDIQPARVEFLELALIHEDNNMGFPSNAAPRAVFENANDSKADAAKTKAGTTKKAKGKIPSQPEVPSDHLIVSQLKLRSQGSKNAPKDLFHIQPLALEYLDFLTVDYHDMHQGAQPDFGLPVSPPAAPLPKPKRSVISLSTLNAKHPRPLQSIINTSSSSSSSSSASPYAPPPIIQFARPSDIIEPDSITCNAQLIKDAIGRTGHGPNNDELLAIFESVSHDTRSLRDWTLDMRAEIAKRGGLVQTNTEHLYALWNVARNHIIEQKTMSHGRKQAESSSSSSSSKKKKKPSVIPPDRPVAMSIMSTFATPESKKRKNIVTPDTPDKPITPHMLTQYTPPAQAPRAASQGFTTPNQPISSPSQPGLDTFLYTPHEREAARKLRGLIPAHVGLGQAGSYAKRWEEEQAAIDAEKAQKAAERAKQQEAQQAATQVLSGPVAPTIPLKEAENVKPLIDLTEYYDDLVDLTAGVDVEMKVKEEPIEIPAAQPAAQPTVKDNDQEESDDEDGESVSDGDEPVYIGLIHSIKVLMDSRKRLLQETAVGDDEEADKQRRLGDDSRLIKTKQRLLRQAVANLPNKNKYLRQAGIDPNDPDPEKDPFALSKKSNEPKKPRYEGRFKSHCMTQGRCSCHRYKNKNTRHYAESLHEIMNRRSP